MLKKFTMDFQKPVLTVFFILDPQRQIYNTKCIRSLLLPSKIGIILLYTRSHI
jgi:hypothetical protein